jgi:hypothetical protein
VSKAAHSKSAIALGKFSERWIGSKLLIERRAFFRVGGSRNLNFEILNDIGHGTLSPKVDMDDLTIVSYSWHAASHRIFVRCYTEVYNKYIRLAIDS